jgi:hypothetical protein
MKQLLSLFLFLLPCLALAQYPSNGNQKITLGEQTTADGLIFRGVAATDTVRKPSIDTMAYMVLDTTTNIMWHYKKATSNAWLRLNLLPSDTASMLTNYYRSGRTGTIQASDVPTLNQNTTGSAATLTTSRTFQTNLASTSTASFNGSANVTPGVTGTLPVANGGTGSATKNFVDLTTTQTIGGIKTFSSVINQSGTGNLDNKFESTTNTGRLIQSLSNDVGAAFQQGVFGSNNSQTLFGRTASNIAFLYTTTFITTNPSVLVLGTAASQDLILGTNNTQRIGIASGGAVTINDLAAAGVPRAVLADVNGTLSASSSILIKENVENINYGLSDVLKLKPVSFNYIDKEKWGDGKDLGFVAEDVMNIIPESTGVMNTSDIYHDMTKLIPILTKAIQEQQALIKALEQRIINLENK